MNRLELAGIRARELHAMGWRADETLRLVETVERYHDTLAALLVGQRCTNPMYADKPCGPCPACAARVLLSEWEVE